MSEEKVKKPFTVKGFFKSTSFKCIVVLLAIVLVSGILLTICNSLFYVSDQERLDRVLSEIYGDSVTTEEVDLTDLDTEYSNGTINSAYYVTDDGNYLINSTGTGGYSGGTATCWVVVKMTDGAVTGIGRVVYSENTNQSWIANVPDEAYEQFEILYEDGGEFDVSDWTNNNLTGGATFSTTAIVNSVNTALQFVRSQLTDNTDPDQDRLDKILSEIYGSSVTTEEVDLTDLDTEYSNGTINNAYYVTDDGNYLINSTGTGGFSGGTVTCWVVVKMTDGAVTGIGRVVYSENTNQSWIANVPDEAYEQFETIYVDGGEFDVSDWTNNNLTGGATFSTTAIVNSVNTALQFVRSQLLGEEIDEGPLAGFAYTQYIDDENTTFEVNGTEVVYTITTNGPTWGAFVIEVTVENGTVTGFEIVTNGSSPMIDEETGKYYEELMPENVSNGSLFIGKNKEQLRALINSDDEEFEYGDLDSTLHTGATQSNFACTYAALFAAANYDLVLSLEGGAQQ